ncbi:MAG: 5-(carboxyamino)imidazole ribonucleotide mutase [Candidatus Nitrospinota bacterium M3_3B_026]
MDILILLGSESDMEIARACVDVLDEMGVSHEVRVASAHRTPERVRELIRRAEAQGAKAVIAVAGLSAHLAGVVASETVLPVIGVPAAAGPLNGLDSLLSTVNMPGGVPVAAVSLGKAGGKNAALLACRILALGDESLKEKISVHREKMAKAVEEADGRLQQELEKG